MKKKKNRPEKYNNLLTKTILFKEYIINNQSSLKISKKFNVSKFTILCYLKKYNIKIRLSKHKLNFHKILTKKFLKKEYCKNQKSARQIGKQINCSHQTVYDYLMKHKIHIRTLSECSIGKLNPMYGLIGEKSPSYIPDLIRKYPTKFNSKLKEYIRKRDRYKCQSCGIKQKNYRRKLDVHHKDSNKNNLNPKNLIALCQSCHQTITNTLRVKV